jgi:hypothetical protein
MELREALRQISEIRQQMAQSEVFRGYRSLTVGFSGVLGLVTALMQSQWVPNPAVNLERYVGLWFGIAILSLAVAGGEMYLKARRDGPGLSREMTTLAVEQFMPCLLLGVVLTLSICCGARQVAWMLPGLWSLLFSLGVFASYRLLPRQAFWVGVYYATSGCFCLIFGQDTQAFAPWQMALSFGGGQLLGAAILYWNLERTDAS